MIEEKIALTLYTLRDFCQTEGDLDHTLARVRKIGYEYVQLSGVPLEAGVIRRLLDRNGLRCCAAHQGMADLENIGALAERLAILGCRFAAIGFPGREYLNEEGMTRLAGIMNRRGRELRERGFLLGYHNHNMEFRQISDGRTLLGKFYDETDPENVGAEIDVHWVARGGGSPTAWIRKVAGRMPVVHFKDFALKEDDSPVYCEVGTGNLDWPGILQACRDTGVEYYVVEQDEPTPGRDIFESVEISFKNLSGAIGK